MRAWLVRASDSCGSSPHLTHSPYTLAQGEIADKLEEMVAERKRAAVAKARYGTESGPVDYLHQ